MVKRTPFFDSFWLFVAAGIVLVCSVNTYAAPVDEFLSRVNQGSIQFVGIDPNDLGNPDAAPVDLAQVEDSDGTLGEITVMSPGFWKWVGKGLVVVGSTAGGVLGGAAAGSALPGLGTAAGGIIGGVAGGMVGVGAAITANCRGSECTLTQDVAIYDQIIVDTTSGQIDLVDEMTNAVLADVGLTTHSLPGGGLLLRPSSQLFSGSTVVDEFSVELPNAEVEVVVLDVDGNLLTTDDRFIVVIYQDFTAGIRNSDFVKIHLDNVINPALIEDGDPIISRHIFAQTLPVTPPPIPAVSDMGMLVLIALMLAAAMVVINRRRATVTA